MLNRILQRLSDRLPCRLIDGPGGEPYLERYYLSGLGGWHLYLHRFIASDPDRGLHDHPWRRAFSLILSGGYNEVRRLVTPTGTRVVTRWRRPGTINRLAGDDFHRVLIESGGQAWTLFCHGPRIKGWGFLSEGQYTPVARDGSDSRHRDWWRSAPSGREVRGGGTSKQVSGRPDPGQPML